MTPTRRELLEKKRQLWEEYYSLTLRQRELLAPDKVEELHQVLGRKDEVIRRLEEVEELWKSCSREEGGEPGEEGLKGLEQEIRVVMEQAREAEELALGLARDLLVNLQRRAEELRRAREAVSTYSGHHWAVRGAFLDKSR